MIGNPRRSAAIPRRWLRFRMRSLFAVVAVCAVAARFAGEVNGYYAEQRALGELRGFGGSWAVEGLAVKSRPSPWGGVPALPVFT